MFIIFCLLLSLFALYLFIKIIHLRKNLYDIQETIQEILSEDTNALLTCSSNDKVLRDLVIKLNIQLLLLRKQKILYSNGNIEIRNKVTNISHDLRTPLTAIYGYLDLLKKEEKNGKVEFYLCIIENRIKRLKELTDEFFDYSLLDVTCEKEITKAVIVNELLEESILDFYVPLNEKGITPMIRISKSKVVREINPIALSRLFSNLLSNALKYSENDLEIRLTETGEIYFINTATRLNPIHIEHLFDRYYTVEDTKYSTGLGLEIARQLVKQMNGIITAKISNKKLIILVKL